MGTGTGNHIEKRDQSAIKKRAPADNRVPDYSSTDESWTDLGERLS